MNTAASSASATPAGVPVERVRAWLVDAALPLWLNTGVDRKHGGFEESLTLGGTRIAGQNKRVMVQARQIYVASHAAMLGLSHGALDAARHGYEFLTRHAWHPDGGWVHSLSATGEVRDAKRDTWIERTVAALDAVLGDGTGAYFESRPAALPRRQNPHMHCFEAMLALFEATGEQVFAERARRLHDLMRERFFDSKSGALRELYGDDWRPLPGAAGDFVEPGHHCEWVWLLDKFERLTGDDTSATRASLFDFAMRHGRHAETGLLVDQVGVDGRVRLSRLRSWPQAEALKASLTRIERGEVAAWGDADHFANGLLDRFLATEPRGLWHDHFGADGVLLNKAVPASSLYHLFSSFSELLRVAEAHGLGSR